MMNKVIVSGANGFLGRALCQHFSSHNISVIAIVRENCTKLEELRNLANVRIVYSELADYSQLDEMISDRDIDAFYHLAWDGTSGAKRGDVTVQLKNIEYACDTVYACARMRVPRFVFASSIMAYEIQKIMDTDATPGINTLYSTAKLSADYMLRALAGKQNIKYIRAVISNIYGPGEYSERLINTSLRKMLVGEHCAFSSGEQLYDFIYVDDAAEAFSMIGEKGVNDRTYYIGSQNPQKLKKYLIEMKNLVNPTLTIGLGELPFRGVSLSYDEFDIHAVQKDTGFIPRVEFSEGIKRTIAWIKEGN